MISATSNPRTLLKNTCFPGDVHNFFRQRKHLENICHSCHDLGDVQLSEDQSNMRGINKLYFSWWCWRRSNYLRVHGYLKTHDLWFVCFCFKDFALLHDTCMLRDIYFADYASVLEHNVEPCMISPDRLVEQVFFPLTSPVSFCRSQ